LFSHALFELLESSGSTVSFSAKTCPTGRGAQELFQSLDGVFPLLSSLQNPR